MNPTTENKRTLGINLTIIALSAIIVGSIVYTALFGTQYLTGNVVNIIEPAIAIAAIAGLLQMKKWGATLTIMAAAFHTTAQILNFQYATNIYPNLTTIDLLTYIAIPIASAIIGIAVITYIFKQAFAGKFNPKNTPTQQTKPQTRTASTYIAALISIFLFAYELTWIALYPSISPFKATAITLATFSTIDILSLNRKGTAAATFTSTFFLFRFILDLQWTIQYSTLSTNLNIIFAAIEIVGVALTMLQSKYLFKWLFNYPQTNPPSRLKTN